MVQCLRDAGFVPSVPQAGLFVLADFTRLGSAVIVQYIMYEYRSTDIPVLYIYVIGGIAFMFCFCFIIFVLYQSWIHDTRIVSLSFIVINDTYSYTKDRSFSTKCTKLKSYIRHRTFFLIFSFLYYDPIIFKGA